MLNVFIINIEKNINKINNIIKKINDNPHINLMKVNPIFIENKYNNIYLYCYHKLCDIFCNFKSNCYGITHLKLIENIYKNYNNNYTLIFENNIIPIDDNLYNIIENIVKICPKNWDIIKLYHSDNADHSNNSNHKFKIFKKINKLEIFEKIDNKITNAYLINKKGQQKILEYKFKNKKNKKIKLNIYKSPISVFEINEQNNKNTIYEYIYNNINLYFFDILFILLIILLIFMTFYNNFQLFRKKL